MAGSNEYAKQNTLASEAGTTEGGSNTLDLKNVLNDYWSGIRTFSITRIDSSSGDIDNLWNILDYNIFESEQPVLVLVKTSYLPYYDGKSLYHYVVADGMTKQTDDGTGTPIRSISEVRIVVPNYNDTYLG